MVACQLTRPGVRAKSFGATCPHICLVSISGFGVISSSTLEQGFRNVDRRFFVPRVRPFVPCCDWMRVNNMPVSPIIHLCTGPRGRGACRSTSQGRKRPPFGSSYLWICPGGSRTTAQLEHDVPQYWKRQRIRVVHCSRHYGYSLGKLWYEPESDTFYCSACCILVLILSFLSPLGIEIHSDVVQHSKNAIEAWKRASTRDSPPIHIIHGNGLDVNATCGESAVGFDRIYVGAAVERRHLSKLTTLLRPGGILVGPGKNKDWL